MFIVKTLLGLVWFILASILGFLYALLRWGSTDTNHHYGKWFSWGILKVFGVEIKLEHPEFLDLHSPCVYAVNHQSNLDLLTYAAICPRNTVVIGKKELLWIPLFGLYYVAAGNLLIHRQVARRAQAGLMQAIEKVMQKKVSIWIFPEGTRNLSGVGMLPFKRGAFVMAIKCQIPIVPIVGGPLSAFIDWRRLEVKSKVYPIRVLDPISTQGMTEKDVPLLMNQTREQMLKAYHELS